MHLSSRVLNVVSVLATVLSPAAFGQAKLHNLDGPQGGYIVYGTVDGATTPAAAMGNVLKHLHDQYSERPQVGRLFRVRGTESDAVFFTVPAHAPREQKAGMLLVSSVPGHMEAAVLSDDATHFATSINPMMQTLFANWHPSGAPASSRQGGGGNAGAQESSAPAAPLRPFRLQDGSAMVMVAEGWRVNPKSGGGTIIAQGPHGEMLMLGFPYAGHDPRSPATQQSRAFANSAAGRNTGYAQMLYAPYGQDLGRTLADLNAQALRVGAPAVGPIQVEGAQALRSSQSARCAYVTGTGGSQSGQPPMQFEGTMCQAPEDGGGAFMNLASIAFVSPQLASSERATLRAMLGSFQVNNAVVNAQAAALAKPGIDAIHEIGNQVNERLRVADRQNDERRTSFEQHNDAMDRSSQGFSNYMLDKSVILDNQNNAHGTTWNSTAEALVKSDPNRYEYVNTPNYWRGIDY